MKCLSHSPSSIILDAIAAGNPTAFAMAECPSISPYSTKLPLHASTLPGHVPHFLENILHILYIISSVWEDEFAVSNMVSCYYDDSFFHIL
jgi:hypothetical protein